MRGLNLLSLAIFLVLTTLQEAWSHGDQPLSKIAIHKATIDLNRDAYIKASPTVLGLKMTVTWTSGYGINEAGAFVEWGPEGGDQVHSPAGTLTFDRNSMCDAPARTVGRRDPGFIHTSFLKELWPNAVYVVSLFLHMILILAVAKAVGGVSKLEKVLGIWHAGTLFYTLSTWGLALAGLYRTRAVFKLAALGVHTTSKVVMRAL